MRTTLDIDDDVLALARAEARRGRSSMGQVISARVRQSFGQPPASERSPSGIPLLPRRPGGGPVTTAMVLALREELD